MYHRNVSVYQCVVY